MRHRKVSKLLLAVVVVVSLGFNGSIPSDDFELDSDLEILLSHISVRATHNYQKGFRKGYYDAIQRFKNRYGRNKLSRRSQYEKGYFRGYRYAAYKTQQFDLLRDSPAKTFGSDFNGDGIHDILAGSDSFDHPPAGQMGYSDAGVAYIIFGARGLSGEKNLRGTASPDVTFMGSLTPGTGGDKFADLESLSSAGDINGDGIDDIIAGAYKNDRGGGDRGAAYIFFGSTTWSNTTIDTATTVSNTTSDVTFLGKVNSDYFGSAVAGIGDVNGDGLDDFAVGANQYDVGGTLSAGAVYVFFGAGNLSGNKNLGTTASADFTVLGGEKNLSGVQLGFSVSGAGDFNGDGFDDILIGVPAPSSGEAYVIFGSASLSGTRNLKTTGSPDFTVLGRSTELDDDLGRSLSGGGDINGDGFDDILVGVPYAPLGGGISNDRGAAYVFFGGRSVSGVTKNLSTANASADFTVLGPPGTNPRLSEGISIAGDINDDGFDDFIISGQNIRTHGLDNKGAAYIFFGSSTLSGKSIDLSDSGQADLTFVGKVVNDYLGRSVSGAGDVNDDGVADLIMGAPGNDDCKLGPNDIGQDCGAIYVKFGNPNLTGSFTVHTGSDFTILGNQGSSNLGRSTGRVTR